MSEREDDAETVAEAAPGAPAPAPTSTPASAIAPALAPAPTPTSAPAAAAPAAVPAAAAAPAAAPAPADQPAAPAAAAPAPAPAAASASSVAPAAAAAAPTAAPPAPVLASALVPLSPPAASSSAPMPDNGCEMGRAAFQPPPRCPQAETGKLPSSPPPPPTETIKPPSQRRELRLRFFNYNMANSADFEVPGQEGQGLADLQGPRGRGRFEEGSTAAFADGCPVDLVFATFAETHLTIQRWIELYLQKRPPVLDVALVQNALHESKEEFEGAKLRSLIENLAATYNGNLKTLVLFSSRRFAEEDSATLFGRLVEKKIAGLAVPNPKKAFAGRTLRVHGEGIRLCLTGAHFPVANLAAAMEETDTDPLEAAKLVFARTLRKLLRRAARRGILDTATAIIVQGDLNSRTVLHHGRTTDVLMEVLRDKTLQAAMRHGLEIPEGSWQEVVEHRDASSLPVTYKFTDDVGSEFRHQKATGSTASFTIGDVTAKAGGVPKQGDAFGIYREVLESLPDGQLQAWGLHFKEEKEFRPFRFPACADRIIYWAPSSLGDRMSWSYAQTGYDVNYLQAGSDHRPVSLDVLLHIAPASEDASKSGRATCDTPSRELVQDICQDDPESSGDENPHHDLAAVGQAVGAWAGGAVNAAQDMHDRVKRSPFWGNLKQVFK